TYCASFIRHNPSTFTSSASNPNKQAGAKAKECEVLYNYCTVWPEFNHDPVNVRNSRAEYKVTAPLRQAADCHDRGGCDPPGHLALLSFPSLMDQDKHLT
ncbi:MAG: hypothetical protein KBT82_14935, partial [Marinobacter sp.]|uniref:hypothetical protein n=1 Tax=Marinobacter sp. TaxID=50741 RepID=UPI001B420B88